MRILPKIFLITLFVLSLVTVRGQQGVHVPPSPFVLGVIDSLHSAILTEKRTLNIYLPEGYASDTAHYPVIYLLDGSADEDFIHVAGLVQFFNFPWIQRFPNSIVVGIVNTNRQRDFTFAVPDLDFLTAIGFEKSRFPSYGGSDKFISFIEKELQPFIEKNYRTTTGKTLIGQSLGGLVASEILLKRPAMFDTYIIMSPSLWWNKESLLADGKNLALPQTDKGLRVYIGVGKEDSFMRKDAKKLAAIVKRNAGNTSKIYFDYLPHEDHATMGHQALYNAFRLLNPAK